MPWLCAYRVAELGAGGVGPIEDADEQSEEKCPENSPHKPIKGEDVQGALGIQWSRGGRRHAWPEQGNSHCMQSQQHDRREVGERIQGAQLHG